MDELPLRVRASVDLSQGAQLGSESATPTIVCKHLGMGQGNTTGLATLAADELDADWSLVRTEYAPR